MSSNHNGAAVAEPAAAAAQVMTFDEIVSANSVHFETAKAWGGEVGLMSVMAGEVLDWLEHKDDPARAKNAGLLMLARSMVGPDMQRLTQNDPEKEQQLVAKLRLKDSKTVNELVERVLILNGIKTTAVQAKNDSAASS